MATYGEKRILARKGERIHSAPGMQDADPPAGPALGSRPEPTSGALYFVLLNVASILGISLLSLSSSGSEHDPALYLVLLILLLSSPLLVARSIGGPYMVLLVSAPFFFAMFGLGDLVKYFTMVPSIYVGRTSSVLSYGEAGVLAGLSCMVIGYMAAVKLLTAKSKQLLVSDWPERSTFILGLSFFALGLAATTFFQVKSSQFQVTAETLSPVLLNAVVLGRMIGGLGEILLAYVLVKTQRKAIYAFVLALIILKIPLGILLNSKEIGVSFVAIYVVIAWVYNKRLPWKFAIIGGVAIALMFPLAYQYRVYMASHHVSTGETLEDISGNLEKAFDRGGTGPQRGDVADSLLAGLESIAGRSDLKPSVELIMARAGIDVSFQYGNTLRPLPYILIPRFVLPDKPDAPVGQLFNREFGLSADPDTWISTSFIGELYWNFSWPGLVMGMLIFGFTLGAVGGLSNLDERTNLIRLLIVLTAIAALVFKFQTGIAQQYSVFVRSLIIIMFLHLLFRQRQTR